MRAWDNVSETEPEERLFFKFAFEKSTSEDHPYSCEDHEHVEDVARLYKQI
jgi:hypothetical protein